MFLFVYSKHLLFYSGLQLFDTFIETFLLTNLKLISILTCNLFQWWQSWIFSIITPVFSGTWSFRNHSIMLIWKLRNISYYQSITYSFKQKVLSSQINQNIKMLYSRFVDQINMW